MAASTNRESLPADTVQHFPTHTSIHMGSESVGRVDRTNGDPGHRDIGSSRRLILFILSKRAHGRIAFDFMRFQNAYPSGTALALPPSDRRRQADVPTARFTASPQGAVHWKLTGS